MTNAVAISNEQSRIIATAIRPLIKSFVEANRDDFEAWRKAEKGKNQDANEER